MLTFDDIYAMTNPKSYSRASDLYLNDAILEMGIKQLPNKDIIEALVEGSRYNAYQVTIEYDCRSDEVLEYYCECPAHRKYGGLCKHSVAVMFSYVGYLEEQHEINQNNRAEKIGNSREYQTSFKSLETQNATNERATDPLIKQLFEQIVPSYLVPMLRDPIEGRVKFEAVLNVDDYPMSLEFRIGIERMYVMKELGHFHYCMNVGLEHRYGKQLSFKHAMNAFEDSSKSIVRYILNLIDTGKNQYRYGGTLTRNLPVETDAVVDFLKETSLNKIMVNKNGDSKIYQISDTPLNRMMWIRGLEDGIEVRIEYLTGFAGYKYYLYILEDELRIVNAEDIEQIQAFISLMARSHERKVFIKREDVPGFCRNLLPILSEHYQINIENFNESDYELLQPQFRFYLDSPEQDRILCRINVVYGEEDYNIYDHQKLDVRDLATEQKINKIVSAYFTDYTSQNNELLIENNEDRLYEFLTDGLNSISTLGELFISERFKKIKVISKPALKVGVALESDLLELKMLSDHLSPSELQEIMSKYQPKMKYYRLKNGSFIDVDQEDFELLYALKKGLNLTEKMFAKDTVHLPTYRALFIDEQLKHNNDVTTDREMSFKQLIKNMMLVEENDFELPEELKEILRPYQKSGFLWLKTLAQNGFGGILADDMGLGKTLQVISFLKSEADNKPSMKRALVICPASLVYNWQNEIVKFAPSLHSRTIAGSAETRKESILTSAPGDILITSYDLIKRDLEHYEALDFGYQIIDEAQYIKNHKTQAAKAVKSIKAGFKLALTGTPIENKLSELWSIFDFLMPGFLYSYTHFRRDIELPIVQNQDESCILKLRQMITPFVLRRLKKDVLKDLPDKIEENVILPIEGEQRKVYDAHVARLLGVLNGQTSEEFRVSKIKVLSELTKLRQICCDPALIYDDYQGESGKMDACMELVHEAVLGGHKVLLFSQFTSIFKLLTPKFDEEGIRYYKLTGATSKEKRLELVERFNHDDTPIFCISLKAGGTGLNLASADIVIHFDPWWNVAVQNQATDRAHRIGQKNVVNIYKLIIKDSIEEKIIKLQSSKKDLADQVLSGKDMSLPTFSKEALLALLR